MHILHTILGRGLCHKPSDQFLLPRFCYSLFDYWICWLFCWQREWHHFHEFAKRASRGTSKKKLVLNSWLISAIERDTVGLFSAALGLLIHFLHRTVFLKANIFKKSLSLKPSLASYEMKGNIWFNANKMSEDTIWY